MIKEPRNEYLPDYVSPPWTTLAETLSALGVTQADLARRTGKEPVKINEIVQGKTAITPQTALQLERALGVPASFWNNRQKRYDEYRVAQEETARLEANSSWAKNFPVKKMVELGWIKEPTSGVNTVKDLLDFFGIVSPGQWNNYWEDVQVAYRKSEKFEADPYALAAWLRAGERAAQNVEARPYNQVQFKAALKQIRKLTTEPPEVFQPQLIAICGECGVIVVFIPELPKTRASGATRWVAPDKALIQLSLRYKTDDHLWFTFFHEAKHVLQGQKKTIFLDTSELKNNLDYEIQANKFAAEFLVPPEKLRPFLASQWKNRTAINQFAKSIGVSAGIVVGQLQYKKLIPYRWKWANQMKRTFEWRL